MDSMLQRHCAKHIYIVPDGLRELMSDISREVLRSQPKNIYRFIADYLDALIITRENARVAARLVQSISEITTTTCEILRNTGLTRKEADRIVTIIQRCFRKHLRECPVAYHPDETIDEVGTANLVSDIINEAQIPPELGESAAIIIQNAYRNYKQRREKEKELLNGMIDWRVAARSAIRLYRQTGVTNEEANRAATLIKAAYKGYYTRRLMDKNKKDLSQVEDKHVSSKNTIGSETGSTTRSDKSVRINYDTVIPHVDFDEVTDGVTDAHEQHELKKSTSSVVASYAVNALFEKTLAKIEEQHMSGELYGMMSKDEDTFIDERSESVIDYFEVEDESFDVEKSKASTGDNLNDDIDNEEKIDNEADT